MTDRDDGTDRARSDFLIAMYRELMGDINRHIVVVWQSVAVLFAAFAAFSLAAKEVISLDLAVTLILMLCGWMIAHVYDAAYWYNRNLVIIANIERQFLRQSDLREIHFYFGAHRSKTSMLTHLAIQKWLAVSVAVLMLLMHFFNVVVPVLSGAKPFQFQDVLPWVAALGAGWVWNKMKEKGVKRYADFLKMSPGKTIEAPDMTDNESHPT